MLKFFLTNVLSKTFKVIVNILPPAVIEKNKKTIANKLEKYHNSFFTYHLRPKLARNVSMINDNDYSQIGIIIQGPLVIEDNFTLETVRLYKQMFKNVVIILSTWTDENANYINAIRNEGVEIILNDKPKYSGALNSNYQIISTLSGIKHAQTKNVTYILKTRSDQRIYNPQSIDLFLELLNLYPPINKNQQGRIISVNFTTLKYKPYAIGDMCMFGFTSDIYKYWNIAIEQRSLDRHSVLGLSIKELSELNVAESYYCTNYLHKIEVDTPISISNSWKVYRELFIVIDYTLIDLFWHKYDREKEYKNRYYKPHTLELFTFSDWLSNNYITNQTEIIKMIYGCER